MDVVLHYFMDVWMPSQGPWDNVYIYFTLMKKRKWLIWESYQRYY